MDPHHLGKIGERLALRELEKKGFKILATNYFCRFGELDIVARDLESVIFVEVKSRSRVEGIEQVVGPAKVKCLLLSARSFLQHAGLENEDFRFILAYVLIPRGKEEVASIRFLEEPF